MFIGKAKRLYSSGKITCKDSGNPANSLCQLLFRLLYLDVSALLMNFVDFLLCDIFLSDL